MLTVDNNERIRCAILIISVSGATVFFLLLMLAFVRPVLIEGWARAAIAMEVETRVGEVVDAAENSGLVKSAERILARNNVEIAEAKATLTRELPSRIAVVMDAMFHPDCPCRQRAPESDRRAQTSRIAVLMKDNARITALIESKYLEVAQSLLREVRIFSAANGIVFLLVSVTAWRWKRPALQLLAPAVVLIGAVALTAATYLLSQKWLHTILFSDYVGLYYLVYMLVALLFLADIVFYRARLTMVLLGGTLAALGGIFSAAC